MTPDEGAAVKAALAPLATKLRDLEEYAARYDGDIAGLVSSLADEVDAQLVALSGIQSEQAAGAGGRS